MFTIEDITPDQVTYLVHYAFIRSGSGITCNAHIQALARMDYGKEWEEVHNLDNFLEYLGAWLKEVLN